MVCFFFFWLPVSKEHISVVAIRYKYTTSFLLWLLTSDYFQRVKIQYPFLRLIRALVRCYHCRLQLLYPDPHPYSNTIDHLRNSLVTKKQYQLLYLTLTRLWFDLIAHTTHQRRWRQINRKIKPIDCVVNSSNRLSSTFVSPVFVLVMEFSLFDTIRFCNVDCFIFLSISNGIWRKWKHRAYNTAFISIEFLFDLIFYRYSNSKTMNDIESCG